MLAVRTQPPSVWVCVCVCARVCMWNRGSGGRLSPPVDGRRLRFTYCRPGPSHGPAHLRWGISGLDKDFRRCTNQHFCCWFCSFPPVEPWPRAKPVHEKTIQETSQGLRWRNIFQVHGGGGGGGCCWCTKNSESQGESNLQNVFFCLCFTISACTTHAKQHLLSLSSKATHESFRISCLNGNNFATTTQWWLVGNTGTTSVLTCSRKVLIHLHFCHVVHPMLFMFTSAETKAQTSASAWFKMESQHSAVHLHLKHKGHSFDDSNGKRLS